jgi:hypothetical protein
MNGNPKLKWLKNLKYREIEPIVVEILSFFINLPTLLSISSSKQYEYNSFHPWIPHYMPFNK